MISENAAVAACTKAAEAHALTVPWPRAVRFTVRALIDRLAVARGLPAPELSCRIPAADAALDELGPLEGWHLDDLGEVHQRLLELTAVRGKDSRVTARRDGLGRRGTQGAWYTPPELARQMCRLSIGPPLDRLADHPDSGNVLQILAIDPACGAGVFMVEAARLIASRYAARLCGTDTAPEAFVRAVMPEVLKECIYGIDLDPVAVDLAKTALWLEIDGREPWTFMDRNVTCGNPLNLDQPPAFTERRGDPPTSEERRKEYAANA